MGFPAYLQKKEERKGEAEGGDVCRHAKKTWGAAGGVGEEAKIFDVRRSNVI